MGNANKNIFYSFLNDPRVFSPFSQYLGDHGIVEEVVKKELILTGKESILDIGCGTGNLSMMFPSENYIGVDFDERYVDFARRRYGRKFMAMDASDLKFENNSFDLVFTKDIFHHIKDDIFLKALAEMKRVLKPSGTALIVEISYQSSDDLFYKRVLRSLDRGRYIREFEVLTGFIERYLIVKKRYVKEGIWGDLSVFLGAKQ